jgi:ATP-binding cassette subfamily C (CFTR/MRP) protein 1
MENQIDENLIYFYPNNVSLRWLAIRIEFIGTLVVFFSSLFGVIFRTRMSPGYIGLIISYSLSVMKLIICFKI